MRVVILGAGQVGETLADNLVSEDNDVTLVDIDEKRLSDLQLRLDIQTVQGNATQPSILVKAGTQQADMLIAVTSSDEVNMLACFIAYELFHTPKKVARIRSEDYLLHPELFSQDKLPIDVCISPEVLITEHITRLIKYPGTTQVLEFAEGKLQLVTLRCHQQSPLVNKTPADISQRLSQRDCQLVTVFRHKKSAHTDESAPITVDDEIVFLTQQGMLSDTLHALGQFDYLNRRVIIGGGGHIGEKLAARLEEHYQVKVIESNLEKAERLATELNHATILHGDIGDRELLLNENIDATDVFVAITNDDEANIMSCLQAKKLKARYVMALINRKAYVELIDDSSIDFAISPQLMTISGILTQIRRGDCVSVNPLRDGQGEAIELIAHGDETTSKVVGQSISSLKLPTGSQIIAIIRDDNIITDVNTIINAEDHVVLVVLNKRHMRQVEQLFQVNLSYFL